MKIYLYKKKVEDLQEKGAISFVYVMGFYNLSEIFGVKIGKSDNPYKRAKQIFRYEDYTRKDFFMYIIPVYKDGLVFRIERLAEYFARKKETFNPRSAEGYKIQEKLVYMRSGSTERYGVTPKQALGMVVMARNQLELK